MTVHLCEAPDCAPPHGEHREYPPPYLPEDHPDDCRGCLPAVALDSLRLCRHCAGRIGRDAINTARFYRALGQRLAGAGRSSDTIGSVTREPGYDLHPEVVEARHLLRAELVGLARLIAGERGISLPQTWHWVVDERPHWGYVGPMNAHLAPRADTTVHGIAGYIAHHAEWLAGHRAAGELAGGLRQVATDPRTWALAYPTSPRGRQPLGLCPMPTESGPCGARLHASPDDATVTCRSCGASATIQGWWHAINGEAVMHQLVDAYYAARQLSVQYGYDIDPSHVRKWGQRQRRTGVSPVVSLVKGTGRVVRSERGRAMYRWEQLADYAERIYGEDDGQADEETDAA